MLLFLLMSMAKVSVALADTQLIVSSHGDSKTQSALEGFPCRTWYRFTLGKAGDGKVHFSHLRIIHRLLAVLLFCSISCWSSVQGKTICLSRDFCWKELVTATYRNRKFFRFLHDFKTDSPHDRLPHDRRPVQSASPMNRPLGQHLRRARKDWHIWFVGFCQEERGLFEKKS